MVSSSVQSRLHHGPSSGKSIAWPTGLHCAPDDTDELLRWKKTESVVGKRSLRLEAKQLSIYIYIYIYVYNIYICYVYIYYIIYMLCIYIYYMLCIYIYVMYIYTILYICYVYIYILYVMYIYIYMLCICIYIYMYVYVYIHVCICIYIHMYIYMYRFNEWAICKAWRNDLDLPWRANWANFSSLPLVSPGLTRSHQVAPWAAESSGQCRRPRPAWCSPHQKPQTEPGSKATEGTGGQGPQRWCHENMRDFKWSA